MLSAPGASYGVSLGPAGVLVSSGAIVTWVGGSGDWNGTTNWSTGGLPGPNDDVVIPGGGQIMVTHSAGTNTVNSLLSHQAFTLSGGILTVSNTVQVNRTFRLFGGALRRATLLQGTNAQGVVLTSAGGTLDGITVNGDLDLAASNTARAIVVNGMVLNGAARLGNPTNNSTYGYFRFQGSQSLLGTGTVFFGNHSCNSLWAETAGTTLTIGPNITVRGKSGQVGIGPSCLAGPTNVALINQGLISADVSGGTLTVNGRGVTNQGTMSAVSGGNLIIDTLQNMFAGRVLVTGVSGLGLNGSWNNLGLIQCTNGVVNLAGNFSMAKLGVLIRVGGTIYLSGVLDNGGASMTLDANTGSWLMSGGTLRNTTFSSSGGAQLVFGSGTVDGVTVNGDFDLTASGANATVTNGLAVNGTVRVGNQVNGSTYGYLTFRGSQTLSGTGSVLLGGHSCNTLWLPNAGSILTIGSGMVVRGKSGQIGYAPACLGGVPNVGVVNQGTISSDIIGGTLTVAAQGLTNSGVLSAINGGSLIVTSNFLQTAGLTLVNGGSITSTAPFRLDGGTLQGAGTITGNVINNATVNAGNAIGILTINGNYTQTAAGTLNIEVGGMAPGTGYDRLAVTGTATLGGLLVVTLANGFYPVTNSNFTVLTSGARTGTFSGFLYNSGEVNMQLSYVTTSANVQIFAADCGAGLGFDFDFVRVTNKPSLNLSQQLTIESWMRTSRTNVDSYVVSKAAEFASEANYNLRLFDNRPAFSYYDGSVSNHIFIANNPLTPGIWQHVAVTYNFATFAIAIYIDGELTSGSWSTTNGAAGPPANPAPITTTNDLAIGATIITSAGHFRTNGEPFGFFAGSLDEVRLWRVVRSQASIQANMNTELTGSEAGLVGYWKFDEGSGTSTLDQSTNGNHGVLGGGFSASVPFWVPCRTALSAGTPVVLLDGQPVKGHVVVTNSTQVQIISEFTNGFIYYTLDGSYPGTGTVYDGPFALTQSATLRTLAYTPNYSRAAEAVPVIITVVGTPVIIQQPKDEDRLLDQSVTFTLTALGTPPLLYQWSFNGNPIVGATSNRFTILNVQHSHEGQYSAVVQNTYGSATSGTAKLTVYELPSISVQPTDKTVQLGNSVTFSVSASGSPPLTYQWRLNGVNLLNKTNSSLSIDPVGLTNGGGYSVIVGNIFGTIISRSARLTIQTGNDLQVGDMFVAAVRISGNSGILSGTNNLATKEPGEPNHGGKPGGRSVWYKWQPDVSGIFIFHTRGSTFDTLLGVYTGTNVSNLTTVATDDDTGDLLTSEVRFNAESLVQYFIAVDGFAASDGYFILNWKLDRTGQTVPVILQQPHNVAVVPGGNAQFSVTAAGTGLRYHWFFNGGLIGGATTNTLVVTNAQITNLGYYRVQISNSFGLAVTSAPANLELVSQASNPTEDKFDDVEVSTPGGQSFAPPKGRPAAVPILSLGLIGYQFFQNSNSVSDSFDPGNCAIGGASRWLKLQVETAGLMTFDTMTSQVATVIAVYRGGDQTNIIAANLETCDFGSGASDYARVQFNASTGIVYSILVDGVRGAQGQIYLHYSLGLPPSLTSAPIQTTNSEHGIFLVTAAGSPGTPSAAYQWYSNNIAILSATNSSYTNNNLAPTAGGTYSVSVSNIVGMTSSVIAYLTVDVPLILSYYAPPEGGQFRVSGTNSVDFFIQGTTNFLNWIPLQTNVPPDKSVHYIDPAAASEPQRFYRARPLRP